MELLNNIWMVLTTPSDLNTQIIVAPFTFIETYIGIFLFFTILNITTTTKNKLLYVVISSLISITSNFFVAEPFNIFVNYILSFALIISIFKLTPFKALVAVVAPIAVFRNSCNINIKSLYYNV